MRVLTTPYCPASDSANRGSTKIYLTGAERARIRRQPSHIQKA